MKSSINYDQLAEMVADRIAQKMSSGTLGLNDNDGDEHVDLNGAMKLLGTKRSKTVEILKAEEIPVLKVDNKIRIKKRHLWDVVEKYTQALS